MKTDTLTPKIMVFSYLCGFPLSLTWDNILYLATSVEYLITVKLLYNILKERISLKFFDF